MRFRKDLGDLTELKKSIKEVGLIHPIVIDSKGNLIAGARRLQACKELGIEPVYRIVDFDNPQQAEIDENVVRKDFTPSEIFEINKIYNKKLSKQGNRTDIDIFDFGANDAEVRQPRNVVSDITGVGTRTLSKINKIFNSDNDEVKKKVDNKEISINKGYKSIQKEDKKQKRIELYNEASVNFKSDDIKLHIGDFYEYSKTIEDNSIDAIITDPPYPAEYIYLYEQLFEVASRILKPSHFLIAYGSQQNLSKLFNLKNDLIYYWIMKLDFTIQPLVQGRNIIATWKPVLIYQKPPFKRIIDTLYDKVGEYTKFNYADRTLHSENWGQAIGNFEYLIDKFTLPGEIIFEPFAGTGTTLVAAQRMKRKCISCELDEQYKGMIEGRLVKNE